ncbi:VanZ family protein [Carnobacterium sp.]|uniref:VanZ family protein n=1 Tax=Carnobacterium sp. TaxID=48221 RepID=UPI0028ADFF1B|nr:VanZ family protein [Carnobacterium sp.]
MRIVKNKKMNQFIAWTAVIVWMGLIFYLSSQPAGESWNLSYDMMKVTVQAVKLSQALVSLVLAYVVGRFLKKKNKTIGLKELIWIAIIIGVLYVVSGILLRHFAPADLHHFIRKNAHFFIYMALGFLLKYALKSSGITSLKAVGIALVICVLYAFSDEFHQYFVPGRGAMLSDVMIDSTGATLGIVLHSLFSRITMPVWLKGNAETMKK